MSEILEKAASAIAARLPQTPLPASVRFEIIGQGHVQVSAQGIELNAPLPAAITIKAEESVFRALLNGETSAAAAFMKGKIVVEGDFPTAMRLAGLLAR